MRSERPSPEHECPGGVKVHEYGQDLYHTPIDMECIRRSCRIYLWDDLERAGFWLQHGRNEEAVRLFPDRDPTPALVAGTRAWRADIVAWVAECHVYESRPTGPGPRDDGGE